ncbi:hypothetical protein V6N13_099429 [Hibiscus sabdariffa]
MVEFLSPDYSYHSPSIVRVITPMFRPPRPFKFFHFWANHIDFQSIVEHMAIHFRCFFFLAKLKRLKEPLKKLNRESYGGLSDRVTGLMKDLEEIQLSSLPCPTADSITRKKYVAKELSDMVRVEEIFLR